MNLSQNVDDPVDKDYVENYYNPEPENEEMKDIGDSQGEYSEKFDEHTESVMIGAEKMPKNAKFTDCVQGMGIDRTFVVMGNNIIVYKQNKENVNNLDYLSTLPVVSKYIPPNYVPTKPILYSGENKMLMLDNFTNPGQTFIYQMDLEKGKIIEEYKTSIPIRQIMQPNKNAQLEETKEFLGISDKGLYQFDPRVGSADKCVMKKEYKKNPNFTCMKANLSGGIAIGNINGEIRLYKNAGAARATTLLPGFGDPIIGIDVSLDGKWVLATCHKYLIVIPTTASGEKTGFEKVLGKDKRHPIRLALDPRDIINLNLGIFLNNNKIGNASFTYATFNNGSSVGIEEAIVTGIGEYIVLWDFRKVKKGKLNRYSIKKAENNIVLNQFRFNQSGEVLVTMPQTLKIEKRLRTFKDTSKKA